MLYFLLYQFLIVLRAFYSVYWFRKNRHIFSKRPPSYPEVTEINTWGTPDKRAQGLLFVIVAVILTGWYFPLTYFFGEVLFELLFHFVFMKPMFRDFYRSTTYTTYQKLRNLLNV